MKSTYKIILCISAFSFLFSSCSIQKRRHLKGYHIEWNKRTRYSSNFQHSIRSKEDNIQKSVGEFASTINDQEPLLYASTDNELIPLLILTSEKKE